VNFLYDGIVHAVQNTIDSCINSATDRRGYVLEHRFTKFSKITQCTGYVTAITRFKLVLQGHRLWYQTIALLVINTNLPILHHYQVMADYWSNFR